MDRISHLPESIVHHILSFLNTPADLVRMSVLSNTWFHLTASFPFLYFKLHNFTYSDTFFKYVEYTTSRFCHQNVTAHTLMLNTALWEPADVDAVNRCLGLVLRNGVKKLVIGISNMSGVPKYRLPDILLSVSVLQTLTIHGCDLPPSLMLKPVKFNSLIELKLKNVRLDDEMIKCLTTSCPRLHIFHIDSCYGFKRFIVHGHHDLLELRIDYIDPVEIIDVEAPNLSCLFVADLEWHPIPRMNLASCGKLTTVSYCGYPVPNSYDFADFLSNFPFIQNLYLDTKYKCNNLKFSSRSLRTLVLHSDCELEEIELSTPNLVLFVHSPRLFWSIGDERWSSLRESTHLKACMQCYPTGYIDALWFQKLRLFLDKNNGFKVFNLYIHAINEQKLANLEELKAIDMSPYELEHVELQLDQTHEESSAHAAFVDAVLWCCRPRSLTLKSSFPLTVFKEKGALFKFTSRKLLEQEDQGHTKIQIVSPSSSKAPKRFMDLKSLSMASPHEGKAISFIKEEVAQETSKDFLMQGV